MTILTTSDIAQRHCYLARARPQWRRSLAGIKIEGGPWKCRNGCVSYLSYRCSVCGRDLADD